MGRIFLWENKCNLMGKKMLCVLKITKGVNLKIFIFRHNKRKNIKVKNIKIFSHCKHWYNSLNHNLISFNYFNNQPMHWYNATNDKDLLGKDDKDFFFVRSTIEQQKELFLTIERAKKNW